MKNWLTLLLVAFAAALSAQNNFTLERSLQWEAQPFLHVTPDGQTEQVWNFKGGLHGDESPTLPLFSERIPLSGRSKVTVEIVSAQYEPFAKKPSADDAALGQELRIDARVEQERLKFFARISFLPVRKTGNGYERVTAFSLRVSVTPEPASGLASERGGPFTYTSALSNGTVYKFGVAQSGVYKLDYAFLKNELGISDLDNIDPRTLRLYGNGGAMLSEKNADARPDDLTENAITVVGESDGKFDAGDYVLFYATGPSPLLYKPNNTTEPQLTIRPNLYDAHAWYFLKTGSGNGLRVSEVASVPATVITEEFDDAQRLEKEKVNLLDFSTSAQGSGKDFYGDYFYQIRNADYDFTFPNLVSGSPARIRARFAARANLGSNVKLQAGGSTFTQSIGSVVVSNNETPFANAVAWGGQFNPTADKITVVLQFPDIGQTSEGWLDYIEINARCRLTMTGDAMGFRDLNTVSQDATGFRLSGVSGSLTIWDVSAPQTPRRQAFSLNGSQAEFGAATKDLLRQYVAFYDNGALPKPEVATGKIENQNLHALDNLHMAIVYHPDFEAAALQLADHRRSYSGLDVATVKIDQVFNEFSSGGKDPTAVRDFARMLFERNPGKFEYLLLVGDASFDPKNNSASDENKDFVPAFETAQSLHPIYSYPADDYFGLLTDDDNGELKGALDVAVGRIPARTSSEAQAVVEKIIEYDRDPATLGDWHLRYLFMADDEDNNPHITQAEDLAIATESKNKVLNIEKVYFDAYQQVATSAGDRFPDAKDAINSDIFKGTLIAQYIGHGGPRGWAQERVIDNNDIASWENKHRYPLIITATCSFGGYDDYTTLTGGEQSLLKANSGAVGLFTTVRAVYIGGNNQLTDAVESVLFQKVNGKYRSTGEVLRDAKNKLGDNENARRFTQLGDPAMYLALPEYQVVTTKINGHAVVPNQPDTLKALMPVELEGMVTDSLGALQSGFNGRVYVTIFDKKQERETLGQDIDSPVKPFTTQTSALFKGLATVTNGQFKINFVVPKDIDYKFGGGKISYYAENGTPVDAAGADLNIIVGGNANIVKDDTPPTVQAFLNTDAFVLGGITDNSPKILVKCTDDYGMNVSGAALGHDLTAVLDGNIQETVVLNDFYQSAQDDARRGQALYPLRNLSVGRHTLRVKGWDVANNSGEGYTEFVVAEDGKVALAHVLNYPNPFTTNTAFQFEHNLSGQMLDVQISIFSVSGKLVKTLLHTATAADGYRVNDIAWDGKDEYGDQLARGVYLYRIKVRGTDVSGEQATAESDFEKLVILK